MPLKLGFVHHILSKSPFISRGLHKEYDPSLFGISWEHFLPIWGMEVAEIVFRFEPPTPTSVDFPSGSGTWEK